ncbi:amidohydrolase family protein [Salinarimonas soli]|uniref:Amidohydrolase family protein n=1 Tax=Salinarimonas soli TaxID=1638099 RepID=A0A5B2W101_9HYPH|nr:amidohydrolase family protein [Salinarimonas soli]KAA2244322.1 amidohydrolase family protein [Salinarimonas soli]
MSPSPRIDAHHHVWRLDRGDYGWLTPALGPIHRDALPEDLAPILAAHGIERTILVQAAPTEAETGFLLDVARCTPFVAGVVGWTDLEAPDAPARVAALAADPLLVGLRPMVQDLPNDAWLSRPGLAPAFEAMAAAGLVLDALVLPRHLPHLLDLVERHPALSVVIDHAAKPTLRMGVAPAWFSDMAALAAVGPRVACKLSGLATEAPAGWSPQTLRPVVEHLLRVFGPSRLIWGSDWPVLELNADYATWCAATDALLADLPEAAREAVLGGNAARVYLARGGRP